MFTGIVEGIGIVQKLEKTTKTRSAAKMKIRLGNLSKGLKAGHSVAVNGVCLTVTRVEKGNAEFEMIKETIDKTDLGNLEFGSKVNIERSLKIGDRLEGHFVLGHIDGKGKIIDIEKTPKEVKFWIKLPEELQKYVVKKGSIALDGISFTLVDVIKNKISVCVIPHTMQITNLSSKKIGDKVNIETDILGKYIAGKDDLPL